MRDDASGAICSPSTSFHNFRVALADLPDSYASIDIICNIFFIALLCKCIENLYSTHECSFDMHVSCAVVAVAINAGTPQCPLAVDIHCSITLVIAKDVRLLFVS